MSRCFKHYDVKQLRQCGCVPATHGIVEKRIRYLCNARFAPHRINSF